MAAEGVDAANQDTQGSLLEGMSPQVPEGFDELTVHETTMVKATCKYKSIMSNLINPKA